MKNDRLKGLVKIPRKIAGGETRYYYYAWRGGPNLKSEFGTPEFLREFDAAHEGARRFQKAEATGVPASVVTVADMIDGFHRSKKFEQLSPATRKTYEVIAKTIKDEFGTLPRAKLNEDAARALIVDWRDRWADEGEGDEPRNRQADMHFAYFRRVISWALDRREITRHPILNVADLHKGSRKDAIWTDADEAAFLNLASPPLALVFRLAIETGQRQKDVLEMTWDNYDGEFITIVQSKTHSRVSVPICRDLRALLDRTKAERSAPRTVKATAKAAQDNANKVWDPTICVQRCGRSWTGMGLRASFRKTRLAAGITHLTFHDLRGTAVTRLFNDGLTDAQIALVTGHSLHNVKAILDKHYYHRDQEQAREVGRVIQARQDRIRGFSSAEASAVASGEASPSARRGDQPLPQVPAIIDLAAERDAMARARVEEAEREAREAEAQAQKIQRKIDAAAKRRATWAKKRAAEPSPDAVKNANRRLKRASQFAAAQAASLADHEAKAGDAWGNAGLYASTIGQPPTPTT